MPAAKLSIGYRYAGLKKLVDVVGPAFAKEIFYTARQFTAQEALMMGLVNRVLPYFKRTDLTFSSHFQTPPQAEADRFPAVVQGENFIYFADPIFREYRESGNIAVRDGWKAAIKRLIGPAPYGDGLPTTILSVPRRRGDDLLLSLLHYIPTRKALTVDMIEERSGFAGELLWLPSAVKSVRVFATGEELSRTPEGAYLLPPVKGRLLLEAPGFFGAAK